MMIRTSFFLLSVFVFSNGIAVADETLTMDQASRLVRSRRWKQAAEAYEKITAAEPRNGMAWFELARASHFLKNYDRAIAASERAAEFPELRGTALYNLACSWALKGNVERAKDALERSMAAGYLDFDSIATDSDLALLRREKSFVLPRKHEYQVHKGNSKSFRYHVVLPRDFDKSKTYPAVFAFPPGQGSRSTDWALESLWGGVTADSGWIVVVPVAPSDGWWTHPFHHAMEGLLGRLKRKYKIRGGKFHLVGFAGGASSALTYSRMSAKYFQSLTTASAIAWTGWDDHDLKSFAKRGIAVHLFAGEKDEFGADLAKRVHEKLNSYGGTSTLEVLPGQDTRLMALRDGRWLDRISAALRGED